MTGWQWAVAGVELVVVVFAADWARRELKFGGRMADYRARSGRVYLAPPTPEEWNAGVLAALIHARAAGDLVVSPQALGRMDALAEAVDTGEWSRKVVPIR